MRSALNRHFRKYRGFDICNDSAFTSANEYFSAKLVNCKKQGKGERKSTEKISDIDLERICEHFNHDHVTVPDPKRLQQSIIYYVIYFFCRRGRENLYTMQKDTFKVVVEPDGTEYLMQSKDELDKNHGIADTKKNKTGRMYSNGGN